MLRQYNFLRNQTIITAILCPFHHQPTQTSWNIGFAHADAASLIFTKARALAILTKCSTNSYCCQRRCFPWFKPYILFFRNSSSASACNLSDNLKAKVSWGDGNCAKNSNTSVKPENPWVGFACICYNPNSKICGSSSRKGSNRFIMSSGTSTVICIIYCCHFTFQVCSFILAYYLVVANLSHKYSILPLLTLRVIK